MGWRVLKLKEVKHEKCTRKTFSKIGDYIEMPNLIQVQKDSYNWFIEEGLGEVLKDISPIVDYSGNLVLEFLDYHMEEKTKYTIEEAKERDATYSTRLHVKVRLINKETGEIKEQEIYLGDFPVMTDSATFIINGAERVIVSQLVRSPSCYYAQDYDKTGKRIYDSAFDFVITNPYKINKLLEYLKYGEYLTQNDLNSIYRLLIAHRDWLSKNLELFGFKKTEEKTRKVVFPIETEVTLYDASISSVPFIEEPGYSLIKRKK